MPFIEVLVAGKQPTREQKERLFVGVRHAMHTVLGSADRQVRIVLHESGPQNYYNGGESDNDPERQ